MSDKIKFRSSVNGFNRSEVISYIEGILREKEELSAAKERLSEENSRLKAECDAKSGEAENAKKELEYEKRKCGGCSISRKAEEKLGAAMFEAKRFSDTLINDAKKRSALMLESASVKAADAVKTAEQLSVSVAACGEAVANIAAAVDGIKEKLSSFDSLLSDGENTAAEGSAENDAEDVAEDAAETAAEDTAAETAAEDAEQTDGLQSEKKEAAPAENGASATAAPERKEADPAELAPAKTGDEERFAADTVDIGDEMSEILNLPVGSEKFAAVLSKLLSEDTDAQTAVEPKKRDGFVPDFNFDGDFTADVKTDN